jgi:N-acetylmuramoyl-L-alanine amidase
MAPKGIDILSIARKHIGADYVLGVLVPKNDPNHESPFDCAEFVSYCVYQASGILYGCEDDHSNPAIADAYTGFWGRDARSLGRQISVAEASGIPGTAVLRLGPKMGHIVISDGRGGTVEAASTRLGVICHTLSNRRWDMGILIPGLSYEAGNGIPEPTPPGVIYRLTSPLMRGEKIAQIQQKLESLGFESGGADGVFGHQTFAALLDFQISNGLVPDGEVGPQTAKALGITI